MSDDSDRSHRSRTAALRKLAEHLAALDTQGDPISGAEGDMLSLIVSGTLRGADLPGRYPAFYRRLLESAELRQAFLDALDSLEADLAGELIPLPGQPRTDLSFLKSVSAGSRVEARGTGSWRAILQRSLEQAQSVFLPPKLAYRADLSLLEDPWFTLLREEITAAGTVYAVALECTISQEREQALAAFLTLAVTVAGAAGQTQFPLEASLQWGAYQQKIEVAAEGRVRFPDIPLDAIYDESRQQIRAGFNLVLETSP